MAGAMPLSAAKLMEQELGRFRVNDPGRGRCRKHQWQIEEIELDGEARESWTCTACGKAQWRDPLAPKITRRERYSRWSTTTSEDLWEFDSSSVWDHDPAA